MGWSSGTTLVRKLIRSAKATISDPAQRTAFYVEMIDAFEDADWDNIDEGLGIDTAFDDAARQLHPDCFEGDDT
jgi:hypothetical protein